MAYATVEQFVEAVGETEAKALAPSGVSYDSDKILARLEDASAVLDTYVSTRFPTPLDPAPRVATVAVVAWAREAMDRQGRDQVKAEADRWRSWARDVSKGLASIGGGEAGEDRPAETASGGPAVIEAPATFGPDQVGGYLPGLA